MGRPTGAGRRSGRTPDDHAEQLPVAHHRAAGSTLVQFVAIGADGEVQREKWRRFRHPVHLAPHGRRGSSAVVPLPDLGETLTFPFPRTWTFDGQSTPRSSIRRKGAGEYRRVAMLVSGPKHVSIRYIDPSASCERLVMPTNLDGFGGIAIGWKQHMTGCQDAVIGHRVTGANHPQFGRSVVGTKISTSNSLFIRLVPK